MILVLPIGLAKSMSIIEMVILIYVFRHISRSWFHILTTFLACVQVYGEIYRVGDNRVTANTSTNRTFLISWGQKTHLKHWCADLTYDMSFGLQWYISIWTLYRIFLPQSNNFLDGFDWDKCVNTDRIENPFHWNITTGNNSSTDVSRLR